MNTMMQLCCLVLLLTAAADIRAHGTAGISDGTASDRQIEFPDTAEHLTLSVDLHTHSVFSDGHVWPVIRVGEAMRDGLDAMAITEHLEYQPHLEDIPHPDRNRAYEDALTSLPEDSDLILIAGSEITRSEPVGHMNAVFIDDANKLFRPGPTRSPPDVRSHFDEAGKWPAEDALAAAKEQGAFVFWNHSWWQQPDRKPILTEFHRSAAASGQLHGIEIANGATYSPEAFQIALDHGLTLIGVSDVHNLIDWDYQPHNGGHRPVNLVFAEARTAESIKKALFEGRTAVWFKNLLIGQERDLMPLLEASLSVAAARYVGATSVLELTFKNSSDAKFQLDNLSGYSLVGSANSISVPPHGQETVSLRLPERVARVELSFEVRNALTTPERHPVMIFQAVPTGE